MTIEGGFVIEKMSWSFTLCVQLSLSYVKKRSKLVIARGSVTKIDYKFANFVVAKMKFKKNAHYTL